jgi:hypothetical protein
MTLDLIEACLKKHQFINDDRLSSKDFKTFELLKGKKVTLAHPRLYAWYQLISKFPE